MTRLITFLLFALLLVARSRGRAAPKRAVAGQPPVESEPPLQMETQYVPSVQATDSVGRVYARIAPTSFPRGANDQSVLVHRITSYKKQARWDAVKWKSKEYNYEETHTRKR